MAAKKCEWCGCLHPERMCAWVSAVEFYPDGKRKRVEFFSYSDIFGPAPTTAPTPTPTKDNVKPLRPVS